MQLNTFNLSDERVHEFLRSRPRQQESADLSGAHGERPSHVSATAARQRGITPVQFRWLAEASQCGRRAEAVGICLCYLGNDEHHPKATLTEDVLREFGVNKETAHQALKKMRDFGLISIDLRKRRWPREVRILLDYV